MKALITGMNGTVAPVLADYLESRGVTPVTWDRNRVPTEDPEQVEAFIKDEGPEWFFQVAAGSPEWIEQTALSCYVEGIRFLFTSSVSVFSPLTPGPIAVTVPPTAEDDYGKYKAECEERVQAVNPLAIIARLGWQIGDKPGSNNMVDFLSNQMREHGSVEASDKWYPSCAHLKDTAGALYKLMEEGHPGLYQLEGNPGLSFFEVVTALNKLHGEKWTVIRREEPEQNNIMVDSRAEVGSIAIRLGL